MKECTDLQLWWWHSFNISFFLNTTRLNLKEASGQISSSIEVLGFSVPQSLQMGCNWFSIWRFQNLKSFCLKSNVESPDYLQLSALYLLSAFLLTVWAACCTDTYEKCLDNVHEFLLRGLSAMKMRIAIVYLIAIAPPTTEEHGGERGPSNLVVTHLP